MRYVLMCIFLVARPAHSLAQQDLKCDSKRANYGECKEREWRTYLGKYLCLIDHVGGIQYDNDLGRGNPVIGRIKPSEDKFFMEISEDSSLDCGAILPAPRTNDCRTKYKMTVKSKNIFCAKTAGRRCCPNPFAQQAVK
jgi:hypothetical protein